MIEAMACGTPVIAYNCGSVPEVIDHGVTGFIVENEAQAIDAVRNLHLIDRAKCRETFEKRFSSPRMADDYIQIYRNMMSMIDRQAS